MFSGCESTSNVATAPAANVSVSKHVGNSVVRSRVKRIISEACRLNIEKFAVKNAEESSPADCDETN